MGLLGSLGALIPACLVLFIPDGWRNQVMPYLLSYATGTMLATAIIGLIPEALEHIPILEVGISLLAGLVLFFVLEWTVIWGTRMATSPATSRMRPVMTMVMFTGWERRPGCWC